MSSSGSTCKAVANLSNVPRRGEVFPDSILMMVNLETPASSASRCRLSPQHCLATLSLLQVLTEGLLDSRPTLFLLDLAE